jgi:hypothetical protein
VNLEELGKLRKFNDLNGNQTCDLLDCNIVPQPTTLLHALKKVNTKIKIFINSVNEIFHVHNTSIILQHSLADYLL